ncbi:hypothetical protein JAAARDRAFT_180177 [Jaapia argillacea MUCL 33604]|uniref:Enoyl reductase (ER) domain-containing protein n=1 Tax=Jaapia argillacea MUCL 33604 TaxID=933084 RepID=A0A067Q065_9AGAM|nr:hypothetical protein JAAARDRAFT_180177 [Jaapia argillacea MUCL 33604]
MSIPTSTREYRLPKNDGIHNLEIQETSIRPLTSSEVMVKVHAVSLQYQDLLVATGKYPGAKQNIIPGSDLAGEIVAIGDSVRKWKKGDRVSANFAVDHVHGDITKEIYQTASGALIDGVLAEYKILPAHCLVRIPEHLSYEEASTLPCAAVTAYNALMGPRPVKAGDTVLVLGTGGVSIFALQFAVASGATVIVTSSSDAKLEIAKKLGAKHVINYNKITDWDKEVLKITNGRGVDHVIEVGGPGTFDKSLNSVRYAGWIHVIGFVAGTGDTRDIPMRTLFKAAIIRGIIVGSRSQFEDMNRLISGQSVKPLVDRVFGFEEVKEAYEYLESQKHVGKVVIRVSKDRLD